MRYFSKYNRYVEFLNQEKPLDADIMDKYYRNTPAQINRLEENQTMAVNALKKYFSIDERDIPCLVLPGCSIVIVMTLSK